MAFSEEQKQHLEFLQNSITRMNTNSFQIKGLMVTIIAALSAIYATNENYSYLVITLPVIIIFLFLDSYYLQNERKIREIYKNVAGIKNEVQIVIYDFPLSQIKGNKCSYVESFFSFTTFGLYFPILILISAIIILKKLAII